MPSRLFDVNLQAPEFPFLYSDINRTALLTDIPEPVPYATNVIRPQAVYLKDTLPSKYGYDSLDRETTFSTAVDDKKFQSVFPFYDNQNLLHFAGITDSTLVSADDGITQWNDGPSGFDFTASWTKAYLFGNTYFFNSNTGQAYIFDASVHLWKEVTFAGVDATNFLGICAGAGYFIAFDLSHIYWTTAVSSDGLTIDFTPTLGTAGADQILELKSEITCVLPTQRGFFVYSLQNVVGAIFSGNGQVPFNYAEILGSAGVASQFQVASDVNTGVHYAWTRAGLQTIAFTGAQDQFPELLEFINNKTYETLDVTTGNFTRNILKDLFAVRLNLLGERFLTISYGETLLPSLDAATYNDLADVSYDDSYPHSYNFYSTVDNYPQNYIEALVYDIDLKRWGKIIEPHTHLFSYSFVSSTFYITYNQEATVTYNDLATKTYAEMVNYSLPKLGYQFGLLKEDGTILTMSRSNMLDFSNNTSEALMLLGRVQFYKTGSQEIQEAEIEQFAGDCYLYNSYTDNPQRTDAFQKGRDITNGLQPNVARRYGFRLAGKYQSLCFDGKFHLTTLVAKVNRNGNR